MLGDVIEQPWLQPEPDRVLGIERPAQTGADDLDEVGWVDLADRTSSQRAARDGDAG